MTLTSIAYDLDQFIQTSQNNLGLLLELMGAMWVLNLANWWLNLHLNSLGLIPRRARGLIGIFTNCFLHKDFNHLFFNSIPLFALGLVMLSFGVQVFYLASVIIVLLGSVAVWCVGRPGNHIGASALITGYFSYIIASAYKEPTVSSIFIAVIILYYFGSIFLGIFPTSAKTSWEGHLFGFLAGIAAYFILMLS